jgi:hypothetical protein
MQLLGSHIFGLHRAEVAHNQVARLRDVRRIRSKAHRVDAARFPRGEIVFDGVDQPVDLP